MRASPKRKKADRMSSLSPEYVACLDALAHMELALTVCDQVRAHEVAAHLQFAIDRMHARLALLERIERPNRGGATA